MSGESQVSRLLDDEHRANLALIGRVEDALARAPRGGEVRDTALVQLVVAFAHYMREEAGRHFEFEERELFTRLADDGEGDLVVLLRDEHQAIRRVGADVMPLVHAAQQGVLDAAGWRALRNGIGEMAERTVSHIQKETMTLLPLLEHLLDDETDRELALGYAAAA